MIAFDNSYLSDKIKLVAGTDEAGRGPLAGPVVAASVIFPARAYVKGVRDSKLLTEKEREKLFRILQKCISYLLRQFIKD
jgi:ribonuclease HII